jgi:hypothetical protein
MERIQLSSCFNYNSSYSFSMIQFITSSFKNFFRFLYFDRSYRVQSSDLILHSIAKVDSDLNSPQSLDSPRYEWHIHIINLILNLSILHQIKLMKQKLLWSNWKQKRKNNLKYLKTKRCMSSILTNKLSCIISFKNKILKKNTNIQAAKNTFIIIEIKSFEALELEFKM